MAQPVIEPLERDRVPALDGLRAISICLVLAAHMLPLGPRTLVLNATAGTMGMSLFFALSGYLIARALQSHSVQSFVVRRLARVLPLAWLYIAVVALIHPLSGEALLASLALILNYRSDLMLPVTEHLWSLGVELHFYALAALLALVHRRAILLVWPLCLAVTAMRMGEGITLSIQTHLRADEILIGACVATLPSQWLRRLHPGTIAWLAAALAWGVASHPGAGALQYLRPYATGVLLAVTLLLPDGVIRRSLGAALPRYVATISYALYVIHPLLAHGWWNDGSLVERYLMKRPVALLLTIGLAHLSTFYWERLWTSGARRWLTQRRGYHATVDA